MLVPYGKRIKNAFLMRAWPEAQEAPLEPIQMQHCSAHHRAVMQSHEEFWVIAKTG